MLPLQRIIEYCYYVRLKIYITYRIFRCLVDPCASKRDRIQISEKPYGNFVHVLSESLQPYTELVNIYIPYITL